MKTSRSRARRLCLQLIPVVLVLTELAVISPRGGPAAAAGAPVFADASFEKPQIRGFSDAPAGAGWTFVNKAGIQHNGSAYSHSGVKAPDGTQTAYLRGTRGALGSMSQRLHLTAGTYAITFLAARLGTTAEPVRVSVDGRSTGTYAPPTSSFGRLTTATFSVGSGTHTVRMAVTDSTADRTTLVDSVKIHAVAPLPTPVAPRALGAAEGDRQVGLTWVASPGAASYLVFRGTRAGGESPSPVATGVTATSFIDTGLSNGSTYYYVVKAVNATGSSVRSHEVRATPTDPATGVSHGQFVNPGFETPQTAGSSYATTGSGWTFNKRAGIQHNGSTFSAAGAAPAPDGTQTAFLQGAGGSLGVAGQVVSLDAGTYSIGFRAARRSGQVQPVRVTVDGTAIGTYAPAAGNGFGRITTASFTVAAGNHTLAFAATDGTADRTTLIDLMTISSQSGGGTGSGPTPLPPTALAATAGKGNVALTWTAPTGASSYSVYRGFSAGGEDSSPIATGITTTSYTDLSVTDGTQYFYTVVAVNASGTSAASNEVNATPAPPPAPGDDIDLTGFKQTFDDEFDTASVTASSPKASSTWFAYPPYGPAGNYSQSTWNVDSFSASNGILSDKAYRDPESGSTDDNWNSGNLSSVDPTGAGFSQTYGYFEARIKMPDSGTGAWPSFWLESTSGIPGQSQKAEKHAEIDIAEWYGVCNTAGHYQAVMQEASHNYDENGNVNPEGPEYLYQPQTPMPGGAYPWQGFHTYGFKVDPVHMTWYIDGVQLGQIKTPVEYLTSPFYMMLDYALGGGFSLDGMVDGSAMQVDWVRAYSLPKS